MGLRIESFVLLAVACATAHAAVWTATTASCGAIPASAEFGTVQADQKATITVLQGSTVVNSLCPGQNYTVRMYFDGEKRQYIGSTSVGTFSGSTAACPNRVVSSANGAAKADIQLAVGCDAQGSATISFATTLANKTAAKNYKTGSLGLPIGTPAQCAASASKCGLAPVVVSLPNLLDPNSVMEALKNIGGVIGLPTAGTDGQNPLEGLVRAMETIGAIVHPGSNDTVTPPNFADLGQAVQQIGAIFNPGADSNATGILKLLDSLQTVQTMFNRPAANGTENPNNLLDALGQIGKLFNPSGEAATNLKNLMASGNSLMQAVGNVMPQAGGAPQLNLPEMLNLLQSLGAFFNNLRALAPPAANAS